MSLARGAREWVCSTIANLPVGETGSQASRGFLGDRQKQRRLQRSGPSFFGGSRLTHVRAGPLGAEASGHRHHTRFKVSSMSVIGIAPPLGNGR
jgi:hypothetical protein